jgi:hypothetical protein
MKSLAPSTVAFLFLLVFVEPAAAQPALSTLWPADVGRAWNFDVRVQDPDGEVASGALTYTVVGHTELSSGVTLSCFDVASTLPQPWSRPSTLLAVSECAFDVGLLVDDAVAMGSWSDFIGGWVWMWLPADFSPGSTFRLQTRTQISDDSFVNGEVRTIAGAVTTPAASFSNAVIVDYVFEWGESEVTEWPGPVVIGTVSAETVGWIAFVPGIGPVASEETLARTEIDCPTCPSEMFDAVTTTMELRDTTSVSAEQHSFGSLKARF